MTMTRGKTGVATAAALIAALITEAYGQIIAFNSPIPWMTQRNDSLTVRAQIDTSQLKKKKQITLSATLVNDRRQKTLLAKKRFPVTDYTGEFCLGRVKKELVGGRSFIKIGWHLPGINTGKTPGAGPVALMPVGIVVLDTDPKHETVPVTRLKEGADAAASVKEADLLSVGRVKFAFAWNREAFFIVLAGKKSIRGSVRFAFDGKNGKNAFLSFADRVVMYRPARDSLTGVHFSRGIKDNAIIYEVKPWPNEITKSTAGNRTVIRVPWYDSGIIPFEERRFGMGIMTFNAKGKQTTAHPVNADFYCPGTWCDVVLSK